MLKVVIDTNVWVSGLLLPKSIPAKIIQSWRNSEFSAVLSPYILDELKEVLEYPKIKKRLLFSKEEIDEFFSLLRFFTEWVELKDHSSIKLRDQDDAPILSTLIISKSNYLVTGDKDLLELSDHYPIITPQKFTEFLD